MLLKNLRADKEVRFNYRTKQLTERKKLFASICATQNRATKFVPLSEKFKIEHLSKITVDSGRISVWERTLYCVSFF